MKVRIVLNPANAGWIIGKMGKRLCDALELLDVEATISREPDESADINHWMSYAFADGCKATLNTMMITHVDDYFKVKQINSKLQKDIDVGICMSPDMRSKLIEKGLDQNSLWYVFPAFDQHCNPPRVSIGIATRVYEDGRKREALLAKIAGEIRLDDFYFRIYGAGWDQIIPILLDAGAMVDYYPGSVDVEGDYQEIMDGLKKSDYYLYMGLDEGALGTLDAIAAGASIITTPQGFHLNLPECLVRYFVDYSDLKSIFQSLSNERQARLQVINNWTWESYARDHLRIWESLCKDKVLKITDSLITTRNNCTVGNADSVKKTLCDIERHAFRKKSLRFRSVRGAIARSRIMRPIRKILDI